MDLVTTSSDTFPTSWLSSLDDPDTKEFINSKIQILNFYAFWADSFSLTLNYMHLHAFKKFKNDVKNYLNINF